MCSLPVQGDPGPEGDPGLTVRISSNISFITDTSTEPHGGCDAFNDVFCFFLQECDVMNYIRETCGCCGEFSYRRVAVSWSERALIGCQILTVCVFVRRL